MGVQGAHEELMMKPQEHYMVGEHCMQLIQDHKDDPEFGIPDASLLAQTATAQALLGLLKFMINDKLGIGLFNG
jgi:hypothetical protein